MDKSSDNEEPVYYCKRCLSLGIKSIKCVTKDVDYCIDCGSADIGQADIETWNKMYEEKYGHPYVQKLKIDNPYFNN